MGQFYLGIDFGGTNLKIGIFDPDMNLIDKISVSSGDELSAERIVDNMVTSSNELVKQAGLDFSDIKVIGVGFPGPIDLSEGMVLAAPNFPLLRNAPLKKMLFERTGKQIVFENDANAAALGEFVSGAGKGVRDMVFFTLGTGIGGGVICNGNIIHGSADGAAELGHMIIYPDGERKCGCGQYGCAEAYASASNTAARANEALKQGAESSLLQVFQANGQVTCREIFEHAQQGDAFAVGIVDGTAKVLGLLVVNSLHFVEPSCVVFAGGMIKAGDFLLDKIKYYFNKYIWPMKEETIAIRFASLGDDAGITGAGALAAGKVQSL